MDTVPLSDVFDIVYGNQLDLNKLDLDFKNGINFISRSRENLGVRTKVKKILNKSPFEKGCITVTLGGTYLLSAFVQQDDFYTAQNIKVLTPKHNLNDLQKKFYCYAIEHNRFRYTSHGREANKTLNDLPVPSVESIPNWINNIIEPCPDKNSIISKKYILSTDEWKYFKLTSLFNISGSKTTTILKLEGHGSGSYPYITTQATNNGVDGFYNFYTEDGNCLTVDSAVLGYCSYQENSFSASDHVEKLTPKFTMNKYIALFLTTVLNLEQYRYNYGRKCSQTRMKEIGIKLPERGNQPDWQFMEDYIKSLSYSQAL
jgi:hypothetical protein